MDLSRLITVDGLAEKLSADGRRLFPASTVRGWINANLDGFRDECVVLVGGKLGVDLDALERWLEKRRGKVRVRRPTNRVNHPQRSRRPVRSFDQMEAEL